MILEITGILDMYLVDVVAYLYGLWDNDIYMKIPERLRMPEVYNEYSSNSYQLSYNNPYVD